MIACLVCSGEEFYNAHGLYFCKICDTQTFDFQEVAEFEVGGDAPFEEDGPQARILTGARIISQRSQTNKRLTQTLGNEDDVTTGQVTSVSKKTHADLGRPFTTFELFQTILSAQTNCLLKLGFPKSLRERVLKIWCMYLSHLGEAFSSKDNHVLNMASVRERDASRLTESAPIVLSKRKREEANKSLQPLTTGQNEASDSVFSPSRLTMNTLLCILYLALKLTDPLYTLSDIIRWIKDGTLPYFNADSVLPTDMKMAGKDNHIFTHLVLPNHSKLRTQTANLARYLRFGNGDFCPVNIELLCVRYVVALNLPGEVVGLVVNLIRCKTPYLQFTPLHSDPRKTGIPQYEAVAMSYIIIVLRDLFGFYHRLDHHLSSYATAMQCQLEDNYQLFNVDRWMQHMLSTVKLKDLPKHNLDTQRLSSLKSSLDYYSSIAPPTSRHTATGVNAMPFNRDGVRKQLCNTVDQLSLCIKNYKMKKERHAAEKEAAMQDSESDESGDESMESAPVYTSTQNHQQPTTSPVKLSDDFSTHKLGYILNNKQFCKQHKFVKRYNRDTLLAHVQQCLEDGVIAAKVADALVSGGNYSRLTREQLSNAASLQALFHICAEYGCFSTKELIDVYTIVEEAYICLQNHIPVDNLSSQFLYFPRQRAKSAEEQVDCSEMDSS